jgi:hypothetical protein
MLFFRKLFKLPTPVDLGWSKYNALESAMFSDEPQGKTWEDWHAHVKELHPVKYWCAETAPDFVRYKLWLPIARPIENARYWLVSHLVPSRRYHMLDLRQPHVKGGEEGYRYGWADVPEKMLYAMFNLLGEYLTKEEPADLALHYTHEQIEADVNLKAQQEAFEEATAIHHWWTVTRHEEVARCNKLFDDYIEARKTKAPNRDFLHISYRTQDRLNEEKVDEMVTRLMKIRRTLWT